MVSRKTITRSRSLSFRASARNPPKYAGAIGLTFGQKRSKQGSDVNATRHLPTYDTSDTIDIVAVAFGRIRQEWSTSRGIGMSSTDFWHTLKWHIAAGHLRKAGTEMLVGAVVMLIAGMVLMGANLSELYDIGLSTQRTNDALTQAAMVDNEILGIELTVRSYALKRRQVYLDSFKMRQARLRKALDQLSALLSDQPAQSRRLAKLHTYVENRLALFSKLLTLRPNRQDIIVNTVTNLTLRTERQKAQTEMDAIRSDEMIRVANRQVAGERKVQQTFILSVGIVAFAFMLAGIGLILVRGGRSAT